MNQATRTTKLICPLVAGSVGQMRADMIAAVAAGAEAVECRLDFLPTPPDDEQLRDLLRDPPVPVIVTCRPTRQGGHFTGSEACRLAVLRAAAGLPGATYVDVEMDSPPDDRPPQNDKTILSHHDFTRCPDDLEAIAARLEDSQAAVNKLVFKPAETHEALRVFDLLHVARKPTLALAMGEAGLLTRILARKFNAFGTFASLHEGLESAPGQPSLADIKHLYRWDEIGPGTQVYGVIGCPVAHSMSPAVHNAAFAAAGMDAVYVPLRVEPGPSPFHALLDGLLARPWLDVRGLSVTIPHKENALAYVGVENCDELSRRIGAINTLRIEPGGGVLGRNTDYAGALDALCAAMGVGREDLAGRRAAVLGAGGAGRTLVAALVHYGADVTVYNRTVTRAESLAEEFGARAKALEAAESTDAEIVINCTSIGLSPNVDDSPLSRLPKTVKVVFDTVYNPLETRLLRLAREHNRLRVSGLDMFVNQAVAQFEFWTVRTAPRDAMRDAALRRLQ
jgi:3-dehydroquinate dehydratase/shikimate dehydrogenase